MMKIQKLNQFWTQSTMEEKQLDVMEMSKDSHLYLLFGNLNVRSKPVSSHFWPTSLLLTSKLIMDSNIDIGQSQFIGILLKNSYVHWQCSLYSNLSISDTLTYLTFISSNSMKMETKTQKLSKLFCLEQILRLTLSIIFMVLSFLEPL